MRLRGESNLDGGHAGGGDFFDSFSLLQLSPPRPTAGAREAAFPSLC